MTSYELDRQYSDWLVPPDWAYCVVLLAVALWLTVAVGMHIDGVL